MGLGHVGGSILFRNIGGAVCHLYGYPGVAGLDDAGLQVVQAGRTLGGYLGGIMSGTSPPVVELLPGETASALVEATDVPPGTERSCPTYPMLLVTPPDDTQSVRVSLPLFGCSGFQVHPVVAGITGSAR